MMRQVADHELSTTIEMAEDYATRMRSTLGDDWFFNFMTALASEDLSAIHDLILVGILNSEGRQALKDALTDLEIDAAPSFANNVYLH